jgi:protein-disulfide isomerase
MVIKAISPSTQALWHVRDGVKKCELGIRRRGDGRLQAEKAQEAYRPVAAGPESVRLDSMSSQRIVTFLTTWIWLGAAGCGSAAQSTPSSSQAPQPAAATPGASDTVAVIDGVPVTRAALDEAVAPQIAKLDEQAYDIRRQQLETIIADRLIAAEAKRRGMTAEALIAQEVTGKVAPVTSEDVDKFIAANRSRMRADPSAVLPQIRAYIENQRRTERHDAFLTELKGKSKVDVLLKAPVRYRASIDLNDVPTRGPASAPVTIVEFSDFHCPYCRSVQPTLNQLLAKYPTQVRLAYKHFPLDDRHPQARKVAEASWCAQRQNKFWEFHDTVYANPPEGNDATISGLATKAGLDLKTFAECMASGKPAAVVQAQIDEGGHYGVDGTPGFFVNGRLLSGAVPLSTFTQIVEEELSSGNASR